MQQEAGSGRLWFEAACSSINAAAAAATAAASGHRAGARHHWRAPPAPEVAAELARHTLPGRGRAVAPGHDAPPPGGGASLARTPPALPARRRRPLLTARALITPWPPQGHRCGHRGDAPRRRRRRRIAAAITSEHGLRVGIVTHRGSVQGAQHGASCGRPSLHASTACNAAAACTAPPPPTAAAAPQRGRLQARRREHTARAAERARARGRQLATTATTGGGASRRGLSHRSWGVVPAAVSINRPHRRARDCRRPRPPSLLLLLRELRGGRGVRGGEEARVYLGHSVDLAQIVGHVAALARHPGIVRRALALGLVAPRER
jgi:hypothetical protein